MEPDRRILRRLVWAGSILFAAALSVLLLLLALRTFDAWFAADTLVGTARERADALAGARDLMLKVAGAVGVAFGLIFTISGYYLTKSSQITTRLDAATAQLGSDHEDARIGALNALGHLLRDSPRDHRRIVNALVAFIRRERSEHAPAQDVHLAIEILIHRPRRDRHRVLNLEDANLRMTDLSNARLNRAILVNVKLDYAPLTGAELDDANLSGVSVWGLQRASLKRASLYDLSAPGKDLSYANFHKATMYQASLKKAILTEADLRQADLRDADLTDATLTRARLRYANLAGVTFGRADLRGADLRNTNGLTAEQITAATVDEKTKLPPHIKRPTPRT